MRTFIGLIPILAIFSLTQAVDYTGYQVLKTEALSDIQAKALSTLPNVDFWREPASGKEAQIVVSPRQAKTIEALFDQHNIKHSVLIEDVQLFLDEDKERVAKVRANPPPNPTQVDSRITFTEYHTYDEIVAYINEVADSQTYAEVINIGQTYEGQDTWGLEIKKAGGNAIANIYFHAGVHAREWIAPAVATYSIYEILENYDAHPEYVDNFNFFIVPCGNPDGYEYSWSDDGDRLWRKTRSDQSDSPGCPADECNSRGCIGVDPNRNWDDHWGYSGVSANVCDENYLGETPFSEAETQNLRDYYESIDPQPTVAILFHSAAEQWLYCYGWDYNQYPDNVDEVIEFGQQATDALNAVNGESFIFQNAADMYTSSGGCADYLTALGTRFVYTPELRAGPVSSFVLPEEEILPSGQEVWAAWESMLDFLLEEAGRK